MQSNTNSCYFSRATQARRSAGFTLIELLVVLVILTLLAGLVGPKVLDQLGGGPSPRPRGFKSPKLNKASIFLSWTWDVIPMMLRVFAH